MKKSFLFASLTVSTFFIFSSLASAQAAAQDAASGINTLAGLITLFTNTVVRATGTLLLSAAVVAFFFGVVQYIWGMRQGDTKKVENGNQFMIWGLVGLFVMFSVYGIIKFGQEILFNGKDVTSITIPDINLKGSSGGSPSPNASPLTPTVYTCPDGVTKYYNQSDYKISCNSNNSTNGNGGSAQVVYTCPDGVTKYYNQSDYKISCGSKSDTQSTNQTGNQICAARGPSTGCTTDSGLVGICDLNNICQPNNND